jgi:hypothetical protein
VQTEKGGDIASASPLVIDTDGDYFDVTGTTNFAAMTVAADRQFTLQFDGALTMTHHATNLDLPGEANITTAAGDVAVFQSTGANTVQCISYVKADGTAVVSAGAGTAMLGSTADNIYRKITVFFATQATAHIKCSTTGSNGRRYNASANVAETQSANIAKSGSDTVSSGATAITYSLNAAGTIVTVDLVEAISNILYSVVNVNDTATALFIRGQINTIGGAGNLDLTIYNAVTGAAFDITGVGTGKLVGIDIAYIIGGAE